MISNPLMVQQSNKNGASAVQIFTITFYSYFAVTVLGRYNDGQNFRTRVSHYHFPFNLTSGIHTHTHTHTHTYIYTYIHTYIHT